MIISLKELYKRFNQFDEYYDSFPVEKSSTLALIYRDFSGQNLNIDKLIREVEPIDFKTKSDAGTLYLGAKDVQPKSVGFRLELLHLILDSMSDVFFQKIGIDKESILGISYSIFLYYLVLQTDYFTDHHLNDSEKKYLVRTQDFSFSLNDIRVVRGNTDEKSFNKYINLFCTDIKDLKKNDNSCLFSDGDIYFVFCLQDFADYLIYEIEKLYRSMCTSSDIDLYSQNKGELFEIYVLGIAQAINNECFHTLYYYPNNHQKMELDIIVRDNNNLVIIECKSGTINSAGFNEDNAIKMQLLNKTKKAYKTLKMVADYLINNTNYRFSNEDMVLEGQHKDVFLIHVSMYSMDYISSNLHALFEEYYNEDNPILSISLEHLLAIILDVKETNGNIFDYWYKRKEYIRKHPKFFYDNNELDLYYEIMHDNSMLNQMDKLGILDQLNSKCKLVSTFRNQFGEEIRPASELIKNVESLMLGRIIRYGKTCCDINKRFLRFLDGYLRIEKL